MSSFFVSNQSQFNSAITTANGGDEIVLASSFKSNMIWINGFNKPGGLTITSQDPSAMASVAILKITNSAGITVRNLDVSQTLNAHQTASVIDCNNITLDGIHVHGGEDLTKASTGMTIRGSSNVTVKNSTLDHLTTGVYYVRNSNITFENNTISQIVNDGLIGGSTSNLTIKDNYFTDFRHFGPSHPDCIQLFTRPGDTPAHDILITGNVYNRGGGTPVQGIWIKNDSGLAPFQNVTVSKNTIVGSSYQGIGITSVGSLHLTGNVVQGYSDQPAKIFITDTRGSVTVSDNVATWYNYNGNNVSFDHNAVSSSFAPTDLQAITDAIAAIASGGMAGASSAIQSYLASVTSSMNAADTHTFGSDSTLPVVGSVADILAHQDIVRTAGAQIAGDNSVTVSEFNTLYAVGKLSLAPGANLTVHGTVVEMLSYGSKAAHSSLTTSVAITGNNVLAASQAAALAGLDHVVLDPGASIVVRDWGVNVAKVLDTLETAASHGLISSISLYDKAPAFSLSDSQYIMDADVLGTIANPARHLVKVATGHSVTARDGAAQLDGSAGNAVLTASDHGNVLIGGAGDTLNGGLGKDTFVFHGHFGQETVVGFDPSDVLQFDRAMVADLRHLAPSLHQVGSDVVIDLGAGDAITLAGVDLASLHASNFHFL